MRKRVLLSALSLMSALSAFCQQPVKWSFHSKKLSGLLYDIQMTAEIASPWHLYSQFTPEGGPLPTKISFNKNPFLLTEGLTREQGALQQKHEEVFGVDVKYFNNEVNFVQRVRLKKAIKTSMTGKLQFMVCNDQQCLPPTTIEFSVAL